MTAYQEQESLLADINKTLSQLEIAQSLSNRLYEFELYNEDEIEEAKALINEILDCCTIANQYLKSSQQHIELFTNILGINNIFSSAISMGLPPNIALKLSDVPSDAWLVRNLITELKEVGIDINNFDAVKAKKQLSNVWLGTALGDQGEMEVLKLLIDEGTELSNIQIKPRIAGKNPDFYVESKSLLCDAKAYKKIYSLNDISQVFQQYSQLVPDGGEVRLYFPKDTYEKFKHSFSQSLQKNQTNNVDWKIYPMNKTHSELKFNLKLLYDYLTHL